MIIVNANDRWDWSNLSRSNHLEEVNVKVIVQLLMSLVQLQCGMRCVLYLEG